MKDMMQAIRLRARPTLESLTVTSTAVPIPKPGEALVRVRATSLNYHDYLVVAGLIPQPEGRVPMSDGAGEVVALGASASGVAVGDRVMGAFFPDWIDGPPTPENNSAISGESVDGFAAEFVAVPVKSLVPIPAGWSFAEAATLPCAGLTAWRALRVESRLEQGATILLPGSGGLSVYALQIAKALGLTAILISSSDAKLARLADLGAAHGVNYRQDPEWGSTVRDIAGEAGVDLVLEIGGQSTFVQSVKACRMAGQVMVVGSTSNNAPELPLRDVVMRHIRVQGMAVGSVTMLRDVARFVERESIRPIIDRSFPLEQLEAAFRYQLGGAHLGKIVVTLGAQR